MRYIVEIGRRVSGYLLGIAVAAFSAWGVTAATEPEIPFVQAYAVCLLSLLWWDHAVNRPRN